MSEATKLRTIISTYINLELDLDTDHNNAFDPDPDPDPDHDPDHDPDLDRWSWPNSQLGKVKHKLTAITFESHVGYEYDLLLI